MRRAEIQAPPNPPAPGVGSDQWMTALATEHFTLATSRATTVAEAGARSTLFMSTVSSFVVALAFIGTLSDAGEVFRLFALVLLPVLLVMGVMTFLRLGETALEDAFYGRAINRIRRYYVELDPDRAGYIALATNDDLAGVMASAGHRSSSRWHALSHTATMVLVVTGVIAGAGIGVLLAFSFGVGQTLATVAAIPGGVAVMAALMAFDQRRWQEAEAQVASVFPSRTRTGEEGRAH